MNSYIIVEDGVKIDMNQNGTLKCRLGLEQYDETRQRMSYNLRHSGLIQLFRHN